MMMQRVRDADGEAQSKQSLRQTESVEIAIAPEQRARDCSPGQRCGRERKIRQVRHREQHRGQADRGAFAREKTREPRHEQIVHQKLLVKRPQDVAGNVLEVAFIQRMQGADLLGDQQAGDSQHDGGGKNPERGRHTATAQAEIVQTGTPCEHNSQSHQQRDRRQDALGEFGHPQHEQDQPVTENQLDHIASGTGLRAGHAESMARGVMWRQPPRLFDEAQRGVASSFVNLSLSCGECAGSTRAVPAWRRAGCECRRERGARSSARCRRSQRSFPGTSPQCASKDSAPPAWNAR